MLDKIFHHYHQSIWVIEKLSRMLESAAEIINRHLRMLMYDNGIDLDLTALWRTPIRINAV